VNRRSLRVLWSVVAVAVLIVAVLAGRQFREEEPTLIGTELTGEAAPDFRLTDHRGETVQLSDFRGKAVALTFIFTNCTDVCLLTALNMGAAYDLLPEDRRDEVAFLAITVDPARDTQDVLQAFSEKFGLAENPSWFALWGDGASLVPVWENYGVNPGTESATPDAHEGDHHESEPGGGTGHTDAIYLIDPEGRERVFMRSSGSPEDMAANLLALL
jgi:protein SCO1/2